MSKLNDIKNLLDEGKIESYMLYKVYGENKEYRGYEVVLHRDKNQPSIVASDMDCEHAITIAISKLHDTLKEEQLNELEVDCFYKVKCRDNMKINIKTIGRVMLDREGEKVFRLAGILCDYHLDNFYDFEKVEL